MHMVGGNRVEGALGGIEKREGGKDISVPITITLWFYGA